MSRVPIKILLLSWNVVFLKEIGLAVATDTCSSNSDCVSSSFGNVCCKGYSFWSSGECRYGNCVGRYCTTDGDCGGLRECCKSNKCTTFLCSECYSNYVWRTCASSSEYCCRQRYSSDRSVCRRSCVGETCRYDRHCGGPDETCGSNHKCEIKPYCSTNDKCSGAGECCKLNRCTTVNCPECYSNSACASSEYCCKPTYSRNICKRSCVGETCNVDNDCGGPDETCGSNHECKIRPSGTLPVWLVVVISVGVLLFVILVIGVFACTCYLRRRTSRRGTVIAQRPATAGTAAINIALRETEVEAVASPPPPAYSYLPPEYDNQGKEFSSPQPQKYYPPPQLHPQPQQYPPAQPQQY